MDGTNVRRKLKILNISFTLPNDKDKFLSASGNFSLGFNPKFNILTATNLGAFASLDHLSIRFLAWLALLLIFLS